ncbi:TPA_asm: hypothetical protein [Gymnadenia rhellicani amalgavirus 1]|nr:putative coat protein [Gymnadenia amalgavirus 1]DAZ91014.1 TPA_asm: hypothetical protein [Gymnadenia rhellicani amalgavirus 1]
MAPKSARAISGLLESTEELSVRLDKRLDSYRNIGLRFKEIDYQRFLNLSLTYPDVEKMLRFLDGFVQQGTLLSVLTHAEVAGVIYSKAALEARDLVFLYDWLKGPEGTAVTRKIQLDKKLTKGSLPTQAPRDVAYSRLLDSMNIDLSVALKEERQKIDAEIADYMTIIEQRKDDLNKFEEKKKAEYAAAANFPPLKLRELRDLCWRKYQDKCVADGIDPIPHTSENVQRITDELRSEVNQEVIAKYCEDETVRKQLLKYGKMKIKHLRKLKRKRETNRFRGLLATAAGKTAPPPPAQPAPEDDQGNSSGESDEGSEYVEVLSTERRKSGRKVMSETDERVEEEAADTATAGTELPAYRTPLKERTRKGAKKYRKGANAPNTSGKK